MPARAPAKKAPATRKRAPRAPQAARPAPVEEAVDLDLDARESAKEPSFTFKVGGRVFRCRNEDDLQWDMVEKWLIAREMGDVGSIAVSIDGMLMGVLVPEDADAFMEMKQDPKGPITVAKAQQLILTINEKVFGIQGAVDPTNRPASSGRGSSQNGTGSKARHDGRVTRKA